MASRSALDAIKQSVEDCIGERVRVRANGGRNKVVERKGVLERTYPSVFVIRLDPSVHSFAHVSYSYTDILTSTVEVEIYREGDYVQLVYQVQ